MQQGLQHTHNLLRWAVVLFGLWTLIVAARGLGGKKEFTNKDKRPALFLLISADLQLVLGLGLYFMKEWNKVLASGQAMHDATNRFWSVEHAFTMLLGILLIHIGYAGIKSNRTNGKKFSRLFWCVLVAMILIAAMVPWPFRAPGIARPWFPGMSV